jgi:hypothetical protein
MATDRNVYRWSTHNSVAFTTTPGTTGAMGAQTYAVECTVTAPACVAVVLSTASSAATTDAYRPANVPWRMTINPGERVSAITNASGTASGFLHVTELT